ncbi:primosomal protein, partial [Candidatus Pelagibacter sp.]|nr:primosomal protein [Candidatus Pelagibacter sp.]
MKKVLKSTTSKKINLSRKKLIEQPLKILKKINIEKLAKFTSSSLIEKYKKFKERAKQKELHRI